MKCLLCYFSTSGDKCNKHLQKSYSAGKLIEGDESSPIPSQNKPPKAVKFLQTLPSVPQQTISKAGHINVGLMPSNQSEDDVSDRELPELAPITSQDYERRAQLCKQNSADEEPDLGKTLSPLGSTSSLQDLIESSSARGSADPSNENVPKSSSSVPSSAWIERERQQKKSVIVSEPDNDVSFI